MCVRVWVGSARKGDICSANVAHVHILPYVPQCSSLNSHLQQTSKNKMIEIVTKFIASWTKELELELTSSTQSQVCSPV